MTLRRLVESVVYTIVNNTVSVCRICDYRADLTKSPETLHWPECPLPAAREELDALDQKFPPPMEVEPEPGEASMPRVGGKSFHCGCGANVFTRRAFEFTCNGCGAKYVGIPKEGNMKFSRDGLSCAICLRPVIHWLSGFKHAVGGSYVPGHPHKPVPVAKPKEKK